MINLQKLAEQESKLDKCPFCGCRKNSIISSSTTGWVVRCGDCGARVVDEYSQVSAIAKWQRRS